MADIAQALYTRLTNDTDVSNEVGSRVYPFTPPQGVTKPYITYQLINMSERPHAMGGDPQLVVDRYQLDIYGETYSDVITVDDAVMGALSRWTGSAAGVTVDSILHTDRRDTYEDDTELYRRSIDFEIAWRE